MSEISHVDCGYLSVVQAMLEDKWTDPKQRDNYIADVEVAKAVLTNQQVNLIELKDPGKERKISLEWKEKCTITTQACSDDCTITGDDVEPVCKEYGIECLQETSFSVFERVYRERTIEKQEAVAENMLLHMRAMDQWIANYILLGIDSNAGVNLFTKAPGNVIGTTTFITAANWNEYLFGYLARVVRANKFRNPYIVDGDNLFQLVWNKMKEVGNDDGKGAVAKIGAFPNIYFDPENIEGDQDYAGKTYLLHKTAVAFVNKVWNPAGAGNARTPAPGYLLYSLPSMNLPGVNYDIVVKSECSGNDFKDSYKIQAHGLFAVNPTPCTDTNTGILTFECGSGV
jgi:hypothetical protein